MVIYLGLPSPTGSSNLPGSRRAALCSLFGLASDGVYMCPGCYQPGGSLLHCPSTLTRIESAYCRLPGGTFLLHCPWSRLHQTLSGILPCEARTFLICRLSAIAAATICLTQNAQTRSLLPASYFTTFFSVCLLYPETASAHKFSENRILRNQLRAHSKKIIQEFQKPFGLRILCRISGNPV